ncbi:MAG TPA: ankyrin repeat domain-containing protein [Gammaproteobacteria bacterium]|nr:ankyrin repeat domain-containing protein [Gammaproteobacteria bacterium]
MLETVYREILCSIAAADTPAALALLHTHKASFLEPIEGTLKHAEFLYCAIQYNNQAVVRFLLDLPVISDISFFKFCGHTPLSYAIEQNHDALLPILLTKTDKNFALHMAVKLNLLKTKTFLLNQCTFKPKLLHLLELSA